MSSAGSIGSTLIQTIESDLQTGENWLETKVIGTATAVWNIVKVAFEVATSQQAQVIMDVFSKLEADATAGKSLEDIETDLLNTASTEERAILVTAGSQIVQAFIAFIQASKTASAGT